MKIPLTPTLPSQGGRAREGVTKLFSKQIRKEYLVIAMAQYRYKAATLDGQTVEGLMDGRDEETVVQGLHQLGYIPIRVASTQEKSLLFV
jgi:hypothetical protein